VGCLLSGGLDSSSIVATARQLRGSASHGKLDTFTAVFPGLPASNLRKIDERAYADAVVAQGGLEAHYLRGELVSPLTDIDRALWHLDEGFAAPNFYLHWALYGPARDRGVRALLDGIDGDTTVSHGLEHLPVLARTGRVLTLGRELRALMPLRTTPLAPPVPPSALEQLRAAAVHSAAQSLQIGRDLGQVLQALRRRDIPVIVLRGDTSGRSSTRASPSGPSAI
jgi:Asparagine synthase